MLTYCQLNLGNNLLKYESEYIFFQGNAFVNIVRQISAILFMS